MGEAALVDLLWLLVCTALVIFMQLGFLLLEAGAVRAKNRVNVAIKNLADFCIAALLFWGAGFGLMFGASTWGLFGTDLIPLPETAGPELVAFFLFQAAFCGTAATIVSGAVAERMSFAGYLGVTALIALVIYPVAGHWAWGSLLSGTPQGWLEIRGFSDFAGSTVVHSVGGWVALAAVLRLGARQGRFDGPRALEPDNLALSAGGGMLLWIGWLGFNGGSLLAFDAAVPRILLATTLAAAAGGVAVIALCLLRRGRSDAVMTINGVIGGLVAITASANVAGAGASMGIGALGGLTAFAASALLARLRIDDAVGAIPAHLGAGIVGTLAVALFPAEAPLVERLGTQALGILAIGLWSFGVAWPGLWLIGRIRPLRASAEAEAIGLNLVEHGVGSALFDLLDAMEQQRRSGDFSMRAPVEPGTEAGLIGAQYNRVLAQVQEQIAKRERLAVDLAQARDKAEAGAAAKSRFLATMSHELRTPLNGVLGMADLLAHTDLDEKQGRMVSTIQASGDILLATISDILDSAKLETGSLMLEAAPVDLGEIAGRVRDIHAGEAERKRLSLTLDVTGPRLRRLGDAHRIQQILHNLVGNALKFTAAGRVAITVDAGAADRVTLAVSDEGIGMTAAQAARVFEPFTQADESITRRFGGTGLGLSIVRLLVDAMGGRIDLQTAPQEGATFTITLPLPIDDRTGPESGRAQPEAPPSRLERLRVLAADDNAINRAVLGGLLQQLGVTCVMAESGAGAIAAFETAGPFDAILMDISMPEIDGCAAMRAIRATAPRHGGPTPPIIACTASALPEEIHRFLDNGFDAHLPKPLTLQSVRHALAAVAEGAGQGAVAVAT